MPSTVEQLSPSRVKLTVEIPFADLKPHLDKAYRDIAASVNIPGFRKGKVPATVIDQRFGRGVVLQEAINAALPRAYGAAVEEHKIVPLGDPQVDVTKLDEGQVVEFTAEVDVRPDFQVPAFDTLNATVDSLPSDDEQVDQRVELLRQRFATTSEVSRKAKKGDVVVLDLDATRDGEAVQDGSAEGVTYTIGSGGMLDGLDKAVTGLKAGESADFSSTLVGGPMEGEPADIHVTVTKVSESKLPDLDDSFAQLVSEFDTVEEMRADLARGVAGQAQLNQLQQAQDKVLEKLVEATDFDVPAGLLEAQVDSRKENIQTQLRNAGLTLDRYLEQSPDETAKTADEFWGELETSTARNLKAQIILDKIADDNNLGVEQEELSQLIVRKAMRNGTTPEAEAQHMMDHNHLADWMQEVRRNKALSLILAAATVTDGDGKKITLVPEPAAEAPAE